MNKKILLVDDDEDQLELTRRILDRKGFEVLTASSGLTALDIFSRRKSDIFVAVLDVLMPGADGRMLATKMKTIAPETPVIFFSHYGFTGKATKWGVKGIDHVMKNDEEQLVSLIEKYHKGNTVKPGRPSKR